MIAELKPTGSLSTSSPPGGTTRLSAWPRRERTRSRPRHRIRRGGSAIHQRSDPPLDDVFAHEVDVMTTIPPRDYEYEGEYYAAPYARSTPLFYYNKTCRPGGLDDRGPQTWQEFGAVAPPRRWCRPTGRRLARWAMSWSAWWMSNVLWATAGSSLEWRSPRHRRRGRMGPRAVQRQGDRRGRNGHRRGLLRRVLRSLHRLHRFTRGDPRFREIRGRRRFPARRAGGGRRPHRGHRRGHRRRPAGGEPIGGSHVPRLPHQYR